MNNITSKEKKRGSKWYPILTSGVLTISGMALVISPIHAQTQQQAPQRKEVKGTVQDDQGNPLSGVSVSVVGAAASGTSTDQNGAFTLAVPSDATLHFSYTGFEAVDRTTKGTSTLTVVMKAVNQQLEEIVVVGYGQQKRASVTGSVATIQAKELQLVKTPNVSNMLAGRLPGLRAVQRTGAPGEDQASVDIRGFGGMLVIVDGIQRDYSQLNPSDIESISILKDASAAVYGFKGANGVLLVTTKKGAQSKPKINYSAFGGIQKVTRYPKMMNAYEYASMYNEAVWNLNPAANAAYSPEQLESFKNNGGTDWWNEMVRPNAPQMSHDLSITGGSERVRYYNSIGYLDQGGILRSKDWTFKRVNFRSNISAEVAKGLTVDLKLDGNLQNRQKPYDANNDVLFRAAQLAVPTFDIYANNTAPYWQAVGDLPNPIHIAQIDNAGYDRRLIREFTGTMSMNWELPWVEGLTAKALLAYNFANREQRIWQKELSEYVYDAASTTYSEKILRSIANLSSEMENYYMPTQQYSLNFNRTFGKHDVGAMALWELYSDRRTNTLAQRQYTIGLIPDIDFGDKVNQNNGGISKETAHAGLVGRLNYAFDKRYLAEFSFRYDGSYKFRSDNRWGFFPGVSLGWRASEESFFKAILPQFDDFKIRGSYAKVGDEGDFDAFQYLSGYTYNGGYVLGSNGVTLGLATSGMANPWLTWYESKIVNLGFDASYKRGLLSASFDWFRRDRSGLRATRQATLPTTFGQSMPQENLNSDINTGFELTLGHKAAIGEFSYNVSANFTTTRIKNDYIERAASTNSIDDWRNNSNDRYKDIRWGRRVVGQFTSYEEILNAPIQDNNGNKSLLPGDFKFEDINNDGIINDNDRVPIGHGSTPRMYYGLNLGGQYKGFDLSLFFQGAAGHDIYLNGDVMDPFIQQGLGNGFAFMTDRWHREDPTDPNSNWISGAMPALRVSGFGDNRSENTFTLHKADYLRLKTIEFGYSLPTKWLEDKKISNLRFFFNCNNLLTFTSKEGAMKYIDPEADRSDLRYYPQLKTFNFGVNVGF